MFTVKYFLLVKICFVGEVDRDANHVWARKRLDKVSAALNKASYSFHCSLSCYLSHTCAEVLDFLFTGVFCLPAAFSAHQRNTELKGFKGLWVCICVWRRVMLQHALRAALCLQQFHLIREEYMCSGLCLPPCCYINNELLQKQVDAPYRHMADLSPA